MADENLREELQRLKTQLDKRLQEELRESEARLGEFQQRIAKIEALAMGTVETLEDRHWKEIRALVEKERQNTGDSARALEEMRAKLGEQQRAIATELSELARHRDALKQHAQSQVQDQSLLQEERKRVRELQEEARKLKEEHEREGELLKAGKQRISELEEKVKELDARAQELDARAKESMQRAKELSARNHGLEEQIQKQSEFTVAPGTPAQDLMAAFADHLQAIQTLSELGKTAESKEKIQQHIQALISLGAAFDKNALEPAPEGKAAAAPIPVDNDDDIRRILEQHAQNMEKIGELHSKQINQLSEQITKQKDTIRDLSERMKKKP